MKNSFTIDGISSTESSLERPPGMNDDVLSVQTPMAPGVAWIALDSPHFVGNVVLNSTLSTLSTVLPVGKKPIILQTGFGQQVCVSIWGMVVTHVLMRRRVLETVRLLRREYGTSHTMQNHLGSNSKVIPLSQLSIQMVYTICQSPFVNVLVGRTRSWVTIWTLACSLLCFNQFSQPLHLPFWMTTCWPIWNATPPLTNITRSCVV